jgi:hypothetical protein
MKTRRQRPRSAGRSSKRSGSSNSAANHKALRQEQAEPPKKSLKKAFLLSVGGILGAAVTASLTVWLTSLPGKVNNLVSSTSSPVLISIRHLLGQSDGCGYWLADKPPQDLTPIANSGDSSSLANWVHNNDVADTDDTELVVTVQGQTSRPVVLTDLQFVVVHRNYGAIPGALIGNMCGGPLPGRYIEVDLSKQPVHIVASRSDQMPSPNEPAWDLKPVVFPYTVSATDTEVFMIYADANQCDCEWYAKLYWSTGSKNGESVIDDEGRPFRTAPYQRVKNTYSYDPKLRRWSKDATRCPLLNEFECVRT